jgi:AAA+ superfamily predicted ATPase
VLVAGVAGTGKTSIFKTMAIKNPSITFIHIKVGELIIITKSGKESTDLLFEIAEFYQPSVIVLD